MALQSPNAKLTRLAILLDNGRARAQFRVAKERPKASNVLLHVMCLVPAGHTVWACSDVGGPLRFSSLAFDAEAVSALLGENIPRDVLSTPQLNFSNERLWQCARQLADESQTPGEFSRLYCESVIMRLTIELLRLDRSFATRSKQGGLSRRQLKAALEFIEQNLAGRVSLRDLAELTGLSPSHFSYAFKQSTGKPPHRWQLEARIRRAQELLTSTLAPLSAVATVTGFADQAHFTRVFRRVAGTTPRVWRRAQATR